MSQQLTTASILLISALALFILAIRLRKTTFHSLSIWIRLVIVFLLGIGNSIVVAQNYIPESFPARTFVLLPLCIGWGVFTAFVIVKIFKMLRKGWQKALFLVPSLFIVSIWLAVLCMLSTLNYYSSGLLHCKYSSVSDPDKTLYIFPNSGALFAKPGFSFFYRSGKLPVMEHKTGYSTVEMKEITRKGDSLICDLRTTRTFFADHDIQLVFNLETGSYSTSVD